MEHASTCTLVLMTCPGQASSLQGPLSQSWDFLAAKIRGKGTGWQHSKQNWVLLAVAGIQVRTICRCLWRVKSCTTLAFGFDFLPLLLPNLPGISNTCVARGQELRGLA